MSLQGHIEATGISLRALGRKAGVAHTTISRLLEGKFYPDRPTVEGLARATGLSEAAILESFGEASRSPGKRTEAA